MRPRISPSRMSKVTWSRAVRPPKRRVTLSTSSKALGSDMRFLLELALFECFDLGLRRLGPPRPSRWQQALGTPDGEQGEGESEDQVAVVLDVAEALRQVGD